MQIQPTFGNYILNSFRVAGLDHVSIFLSNSQGLVPFEGTKKTVPTFRCSPNQKNQMAELVVVASLPPSLPRL